MSTTARVAAATTDLEPVPPEPEPQRHLLDLAELEREVDAVRIAFDGVERMDERLGARAGVERVRPAAVRARLSRHRLAAHEDLVLAPVDDHLRVDATGRGVRGAHAVARVPTGGEILDQIQPGAVR